MDYLYKHRDHSRKLPFDIVNIIYEYADPLAEVKKQIVNKDYDLDEIMYKRRLKALKNNLSKEELERTNIYDNNFKQTIINNYKRYFLCNADNETYRQLILGFDPRRDIYHSIHIILRDLEANGHNVNRDDTEKQLYDKWVKL
jgi:hypothetical protein